MRLMIGDHPVQQFINQTLRQLLPIQQNHLWDMSNFSTTKQKNTVYWKWKHCLPSFGYRQTCSILLYIGKSLYSLLFSKLDYPAQNSSSPLTYPQLSLHSCPQTRETAGCNIRMLCLRGYFLALFALDALLPRHDILNVWPENLRMGPYYKLQVHRAYSEISSIVMEWWRSRAFLILLDIRLL